MVLLVKPIKNADDVVALGELTPQDTAEIIGPLVVESDSEFNSVGGLKIPTGATSQRSTTPKAGMIRFNTELGFNESFNGVDWVLGTGPQGPAGADGAQGPQGPAGVDGAQGPAGPADWNAIPNIPPTLCYDGNNYNIGAARVLNNASWMTFNWADAGVATYYIWGSDGADSARLMSLATLAASMPAGPQGPQGPQGEVGPQGPAGGGVLDFDVIGSWIWGAITLDDFYNEPMPGSVFPAGQGNGTVTSGAYIESKGGAKAAILSALVSGSWRTTAKINNVDNTSRIIWCNCVRIA